MGTEGHQEVSTRSLGSMKKHELSLAVDTQGLGDKTTLKSRKCLLCRCVCVSVILCVCACICAHLWSLGARFARPAGMTRVSWGALDAIRTRSSL